jgi:hypothetical protein
VPLGRAASSPSEDIAPEPLGGLTPDAALSSAGAVEMATTNPSPVETDADLAVVGTALPELPGADTRRDEVGSAEYVASGLLASAGLTVEPLPPASFPEGSSQASHPLPAPSETAPTSSADSADATVDAPYALERAPLAAGTAALIASVPDSTPQSEVAVLMPSDDVSDEARAVDEDWTPLPLPEGAYSALALFELGQRLTAGGDTQSAMVIYRRARALAPPDGSLARQLAALGLDDVPP